MPIFASFPLGARCGGPGGVFAGRLDPSGDSSKTYIPEGQALASELLARCFEELRWGKSFVGVIFKRGVSLLASSKNAAHA